MDTAAWYVSFADNEAAGTSPSYERLARRVAADPALLGRIELLPPPKRQPNLLFSAVRFIGGPVADADEFAAFVDERWATVADVLDTHATQTNEAARTGAVLPLLAAIDGPIALIEVGTSAGLCLYPDRYAIHYDGRSALCDSSVHIDVATAGELPLPTRLPEIVERIGIDRNPLDVTNAADLAWLDACIWPEHDDRRQRLHAAAALVAAAPPRLVRGDVLDVADVLAAVPAGVTPVVIHSAVLPYLRIEHRAQFVELVTADPRVVWIANEMPGAIDGVVTELGPPAFASIAAYFVVARDGRAVAVSDPHGRWVRWPDGVS